MVDENKIQELFGGFVVRKDLSKLVKGLDNTALPGMRLQRKRALKPLKKFYQNIM